MLLLKGVECIKKVVIIWTKLNGHSIKENRCIATISNRAYIYSDYRSRSINSLPSTTLMLAVGVWRARFMIK
jgi:hypothetical protein